MSTRRILFSLTYLLVCLTIFGEVPRSSSNDKVTNVRDCMMFFDSLKTHTLREYQESKRLDSITLPIPETGETLNLPKPFLTFQPIGGTGQTNDQIREEIQRTQNQLGIINEEIAITRYHLETLISGIQAQTQRLTQQPRVAAISRPNLPILCPQNVPTLQTPPPGSPIRLPIAGPALTSLPPETGQGLAAIARMKGQVGQLHERLRHLQEQQRLTMQRLAALRNQSR